MRKKALEEHAAEERKEDDERAADPSAWAARVRAEHASVTERIKERNRRESRTRKPQECRVTGTDGKYCIASLATNERVGKKRRKRGGGAHVCPNFLASSSLSTGLEDMFGADDEDWLSIARLYVCVYHLLRSVILLCAGILS